jgi:hypothetical protein
MISGLVSVSSETRSTARHAFAGKRCEPFAGPRRERPPRWSRRAHLLSQWRPQAGHSRRPLDGARREVPSRSSVEASKSTWHLPRRTSRASKSTWHLPHRKVPGTSWTARKVPGTSCTAAPKSTWHPPGDSAAASGSEFAPRGSAPVTPRGHREPAAGPVLHLDLLLPRQPVLPGDHVLHEGVGAVLGAAFHGYVASVG